MIYCYYYEKFISRQWKAITDSFIRNYFFISRMPIKSIKARQIFDSRGNPTVEVDLVRIQY